MLERSKHDFAHRFSYPCLFIAPDRCPVSTNDNHTADSNAYPRQFKWTLKRQSNIRCKPSMLFHLTLKPSWTTMTGHEPKSSNIHSMHPNIVNNLIMFEAVHKHPMNIRKFVKRLLCGCFVTFHLLDCDGCAIYRLKTKNVVVWPQIAKRYLIVHVLFPWLQSIGMVK